jgi:hypothetical protein
MRGRAAHALSVNDNAELKPVHINGAHWNEEGKAKGSLPGTMHAFLVISATFSGKFVFYTHDGQISGSGSAQPREGKPPYETFSGSSTITGGTGRYRHVRGHLAFYGALNRQSDVVQFQTRGTLSD